MENYKKSLKIIFAGTPYFAAYHLKKIISSHHTVLGVLTQPDRPNKRGNIIIPSPVKIIAQKNNIPIFQPKNIKNKKNHLDLLSINADIMIVVAYGLLLPKFILNKFSMGCINIHASLLPRWRGAAPIQYAILNGDKKTGISIIQMEEKLDSGNILYQKSCKISKKETTISLTKKLYKIGSKSILKILKKIIEKKIIQKKQNEKKITYAKKISKIMGKINFNINAKKIERMIRAFNPWPGTYIIIKNYRIKIHAAKILKNNKKYHIGEIIKINKFGIQIQTKKDILNIIKIQIPGKKIIKICEFIKNKNHIFNIHQII
ncbi:methionyl-tRNA formyltransferase [Buchnera aphidicola]|uniref:Methionyl-tRNA formyltransferase n=1 Tax=Buchnera aphidicola (Therioaphis trifolii) TaxID=1241884 RepID=A0A4D6YDK4_9GAMM|nr:methionyl-tRNA formyltransferase [Buchnera aphidicola]QCI27309.1 methionyl-tRNA formyltransferase [Buchnera aphidicola (Therioaphis trifolii)]